MSAHHLWREQVATRPPKLTCATAGPYAAVLNPLTSPGMVAATLAGLSRGGSMAEISKRDIWSPQRIAQVLELESKTSLFA